MHEVHLVREIIDSVERQAKSKGAKRVKKVKIRFNRLTSHSAEHVRFSFDIVKRESRMAKDALLDLIEVKPLVRCVKCRHEFEANQLPEMCPKCDSVEVQPVTPTDMLLEGFEIER